MAKFTRTPWLEIQAMKDEIGTLMDDVRRDAPCTHRICANQAHFTPVADVCATPEAFVVQVELCGLEKDAVTVEVLSNELWVYGERRPEKEVSGGTYHVLERFYGPFARHFVFSEGIDVAGSRACMQKGVLTIILPKKHRCGQGKRIEIVQKQETTD